MSSGLDGSSVCGPSRQQVIARKRFVQASDGLNTCLPSESGVQSISSGLTGTCQGALMVGSVVALQTWKAICWLWGQIQTISASLADYATTAALAALQAQVTTNTNNITAIQAQLPPSHPPGTPTLTPLGALGSSPTVTLVAGDDTKGYINIILGSAPTAAGGSMVGITFASPFTNTCRVLLGVSGATGPARGLVADCTPPASGGFSSLVFSVFDPAAALVQNQQIRISYDIQQLAP